MIQSSVLVCIIAVAFVAATNVQQCPGRSDSGLSDAVQLMKCKKAPCKLKKGTNQAISITFTPEQDVAAPKNAVSADLYGIKVPFVGVDGNSICDKIYTEDGTAASCPLKAATKYVYKDEFPILEIYPNVRVNVHWAIKDGAKDLSCFQVGAQIQ